jgi:hypothetical protein
MSAGERSRRTAGINQSSSIAQVLRPNLPPLINPILEIAQSQNEDCHHSSTHAAPSRCLNVSPSALTMLAVKSSSMAVLMATLSSVRGKWGVGLFRVLESNHTT